VEKKRKKIPRFLQLKAKNQYGGGGKPPNPTLL